MTHCQITLKRIYDSPAEEGGYRVLVDALWPRGVSKEKAALDLWLPSVAPSTELRHWFNHDVARWAEFQARYRKELDEPERRKALEELRAYGQAKPLTLLYAARDQEHNNAVVLKDILQR